MNIICPIDCYTGYGITGYNIWKSLYNKNKNIKLFLQNGGNFETSWNIEGIKKSINNKINFDSKEPCFKLWHGNELFTRTHGTSKCGALSFFELDTLTDIEKHSYNLVDIIFMPSLWAKNVLENNGIKKPIIVCPQGVDTDIFNAEVPKDKTEKNTYVFINIGKWEIRKGHDVLIEMFNGAFEESDDVELWMINHNPFLNKNQIEQWHNLYSSSKLGSKIRFFPRLPDQATVSKVMSYADCGIFPSRGEGWNNEAIEIMAMNKPIIITDYSAHTQFCNSDNAYLININSVEPAHDNMWFNGEGNWAAMGDSQISEGIQYMKYVYKNNIRNNINGLKTALDLSWHNTANTIHTNMIN